MRILSGGPNSSKGFRWVVPASLLLLPLSPATGPVYAGSGAVVALHVQAGTAKAVYRCRAESAGGSAPTELPCSSYNTRGRLGVPYTVYLVVVESEGAGVAGVSCGVDYDGQAGRGVDILDWTLCSSGLEFTNPGGSGEWPAAGSGNRITWLLPEDCQSNVIAPDGVHAIAGSFYVVAYGEDRLRVTRNGVSIPELAVVTCDGTHLDLTGDQAGVASFSPGAVLPGLLPCADFPYCYPMPASRIDFGEVPLGGSSELFFGAGSMAPGKGSLQDTARAECGDFLIVSAIGTYRYYARDGGKFNAVRIIYTPSTPGPASCTADIPWLCDPVVLRGVGGSGEGGVEGLDLLFRQDSGGTELGASVSGAGDMNGDGFDDVIVGSSYKAFIHFGGPVLDALPDVTLTSPQERDLFGWSVSGAGDVNGDGFSDIVVGAPGAEVGGNKGAGRAYVIYGGESPDAVPDVALEGESVNERFGDSVSGAGDVNKDGYGDILVCAPGRESAYVYFGGPDMDTVPDVVLSVKDAMFGERGSGAGDLNGDGYADVAVVAMTYRVVGGIFVFYGGDPMDNVPDLLMVGETFEDEFGISIGAAGDVNGDGFDDLIVGASDIHGRGERSGRAYVYFGSSEGDGFADLVLTGTSVRELFGTSVAGVGDVNGDGFADFAVGSFGNPTGAIRVYYGGPDVDVVPDALVTEDPEVGDFGFVTAGAGDVNGDGLDDLVVGSIGSAFVYGRRVEDDSPPESVTSEQLTLSSEGTPLASMRRIDYDLPEPARVMLSIHDVSGRLIDVLVATTENAGPHSASWRAGGSPNGIYFVRLEAGSRTRSLKLLVLH